MATVEESDSQQGFKLTEAELQSLKNDLVTSVSSESVAALDEGKIEQKWQKKKARGPPPPVDRDAMGVYKPPPGGKQRSCMLHATPAPNAYSADKPGRRAPAHALGQVFYKREDKRRLPGPQYQTAGDASWGRCRRLTILGKQPTSNATAGPGPAGYCPKIPARGGAATIKGKPKGGAVHGFVCPLAMRTGDPKAPAANAYSCEPKWDAPATTLGAKPTETKPPRRPAPNKYNVRDSGCRDCVKPGWTMGKKIKELSSKSDNPSPAAYRVRGTMGDGPKARVIGERNAPVKRCTGPAPNEYDRAGFDLSEPGWTMKYRWFDNELDLKEPGPANYRPRHACDSTAPRAPAASIKSRSKPTYPSSVYGRLYNWAPCPSSYNTRKPDDGRASSIGKKLPAKKKSTPGPADYLRHNGPLARAPEWPMLGARAAKPLHATPAPNAYTIKLDDGQGKTFGELHKQPNASHESPGPANYMARAGAGECQCHVTLKSRHSPCRYQGMRTAAPPVNPNPTPAVALLFGANT